MKASTSMETLASILASAAGPDDASACRHLLASDPAASAEALLSAARHGRSQCMAALLAHISDDAIIVEALASAIYDGHVECVRLLMPACSSMGARGPGFFSLAAHFGRLSTVALMAEMLPELVSSADIPSMIDDALSQDDSSMAALLTSFGERKELSESCALALPGPSASVRL